MGDQVDFLLMRIDERRYALPLAVVERVVRAVDVTPLPGAPAMVLGAINAHGRLVPVVSLRRRFGLPEREITPANEFVLAATRARIVALEIDEAEGVVQQTPDRVVASSDISPGLRQFPGVMNLADDLVLIYDLEALLSLEEARRLDTAVANSLLQA